MAHRLSLGTIWMSAVLLSQASALAAELNPLCHVLLMNSAGFVREVETAVGLPAQGFISDADQARVNEWLNSASANSLLRKAEQIPDVAAERARERTAKDGAADEVFVIQDSDYQLAFAEIFPLPAGASAAAPAPDVPEDLKAVGEFWTSTWVAELLNVSEELMVEASKLIGRLYRPLNAEDRVDFIAELMRPEKTEIRVWLTAWAKSVRFRYEHTPAPSGVTRREVLAMVSTKEFHWAQVRSSVLGSLQFRPVRHLVDEALAYARTGAGLGDLKYLADEVFKFAQSNRQKLLPQGRGKVIPGLKQSELADYSLEFVGLALRVLALSERMKRSGPEMLDSYRTFVHEQIFDRGLDRMLEPSVGLFQELIRFNPTLMKVFLSARGELLDFAGPF